MNIAALSRVLAAIFAWGVISARAAVISTPIFFVAIGLLMAEGLRLIDLQPDPHTTKIIAEVTLVWVLFADASRARFSDLREDLRYYVRLLAVGLPLTTALGTAALAAIATQVGMGPRRARAWLDRFGFGRADRCGA
jgi:NhaP-type Na+/H+ or K+/H+ antiporter